MRAWLMRWLGRLEARVTTRRDSASALVLVECTLPLLLLLWGMQLYAAWRPDLTVLYRPDWLWPSLWLQAGLMAWLLMMGVIAWGLRRDKRPMNWLVQMTALPAGWGVLLLSIGMGLKDTPLCMILMAEFVFLRSLLPVRHLKVVMWGALLILVAGEVAVLKGWMPYAPMLARPVYQGDGFHWWWALWTRVLYVCAAAPLCGWFFFLAASLHRNRAALENVARTDALTGLANRREFMHQMERESHRQARGGRPLSIVMLDVDHFKRVNDTHGHPAGDAVLARLGDILRGSIRARVDVAARHGGEEFVLLLPETDLQGAMGVAEKIRARLRQERFESGGQAFEVKLSAGVAQVVGGDTDWALRVADANLYEAKNTGRDRIVATVAHEPLTAGA